MAQIHHQEPSHWQTRIWSLDIKSCWFTSNGLLWCAALLVSSPPAICQLFLRQLQTVTVQIQAESRALDPDWEAQKGSFWTGEWGQSQKPRQPLSALTLVWSVALEVKDGRNALSWYGTVWSSVVWLAMSMARVSSALASWAYVKALMRRPFVLGRQAHLWVNELEQRRPFSMVAVCLHQSVPSYFISSPAHRQPLMS